ncbi:MAG: aminotransferase class I/II-fold pyridoxal phosphate-dependent enzyme [Bifidobacteriaceae bacterium]|jgi:cystathionine beta-lyase|nr:aminotransferase class I/II-fold pyridoxal phosphate-dependent enzyme [Bifidobacteriaceae bacterium]
MRNIFNIYNEKELRLRTSKKWGTHGKDIIPLDIAEVDVPFGKSIINELSFLTRYADCGYISEKDISEYKEVYSDYYSRKHQKNIDAEKAVIFPGVIAASRILSQIYFETKKAAKAKRNIIISSPVYPPFITTIAEDFKLHDVPLNKEWRLDLNALEKKFKSLKGQSAIYLLCNPQNPTGTIHTSKELQTLVDYSNKYGVFIISDEIYSDMLRPGEFNSLICVKGAKRAISVISPSKAFGLPGLKSSIVFPFGEGEKLVEKAPKVITHILNHYPVRCAIAAYKYGDKYLKEFRASLDENFKYFDDLMKKHLPDAKVYYTGAVPLAWVDMKAYEGVNAQFIYKNAKVSVNDGVPFGGAKYKTFIRFNVATNQRVLKKGIVQIENAIKNQETKG